MARPREKPVADAGRIASTRRARRGEAAPRAAKASSGRGKKASGKKQGGSTSSLARGFKLVMLVVMMAVAGFGVVLVADVGLTLIGSMKLGTITFAELVDKVHDRVLDEDVPEARKNKAAKPAPRSKPPATPKPVVQAPAPTVRAELPAPAPDDYAREAEVRPDPEVQAARARLDQLLKGL